MLVMDVEFRIQDANRAYLEATNRDLNDLVGRDMFDAFPENPQHADGDDGVTNLRASLHEVLATCRPHSMAVQRYDVPWGGAYDDFVERYWCPVNTPIIGESGELVGILHMVEDVSGFHEDIAATHEFYRSEIDAQGASGEDTELRFADYARVAMRNARFYADVVAEVDHLRDALHSRDVIGTAKGIVMAEKRCGPEEAFAFLVSSSQANNIKLRDLAATLVARVASGDGVR